VVAEIGSCGGDLGLACDTAQAAIEAGAWMVKGQMYAADRLVTKDAPTYGKDSIAEPATQYEAFSNTLTYDEWGEVAATIPGKFFASVFDLEACQDYPYEHIKIASADITYRGLIEAAAATGAQLIMSTGASTTDEISQAVIWSGVQPTLMICTLCYPTEPSDANVRRVLTLLGSWPDTGYSDHTRGIQASHLAFEYGAVMVEKHFTITPGEGGDHDFAIGPEDLARLVTSDVPVSEGVRAVYSGTPTLGVLGCEAPARHLARRSIHAKTDIPPGAQITRDMLTVIRPATGLAPWLLEAVKGQIGADFSPVGKLANVAIAAGTPITPNLFGGVRFNLTVE
jgi:sialic acid synthase SpsE